MAWRVFNSLLVLRDQVNALAPSRDKGADGTICDTNHPTTSDHCPHSVAGVGSEMVSALDLTHDPVDGFDSYMFAEVLRTHRDNRIKYVISNRRIFSSYTTSARSAWTWGSYSGTDPHTNHIHISVLDTLNSDTKTPWNLEGFETDMTPGQQYVHHVMNYRIDAILHMRATCQVPAFTATDGSRFPAITENNDLAAAIRALSTDGTSLPVTYRFEGTAISQA